MIKLKKIKPMFTSIVTTMDKYETTQLTSTGLLSEETQVGRIKEYQTVLAIGSSVRDVSVGDLVCINPSRFMVKQHQQGSLNDGIIQDNPIIKYNFDVIIMNEEPCLLIQNSDIDFVVEDYEHSA